MWHGGMVECSGKGVSEGATWNSLFSVVASPPHPPFRSFLRVRALLPAVENALTTQPCNKRHRCPTLAEASTSPPAARGPLVLVPDIPSPPASTEGAASILLDDFTGISPVLSTDPVAADAAAAVMTAAKEQDYKSNPTNQGGPVEGPSWSSQSLAAPTTLVLDPTLDLDCLCDFDISDNGEFCGGGVFDPDDLALLVAME